VQDELIEALDIAGNTLPEAVSRAEAHRRGVWHRAVSIFVLNPRGEILIEQRSQHKDLFPGLYDIPGGHVKPGQRPAEAALEELREEVDLTVEPSRLDPLSDEDAVIERVVLPDKAIINLERKTVYLVQISYAEEEAILCRAAEWSHVSTQELERRGPEGEVSRAEFWGWERLQGALGVRDHRILASGVESALSEDEVRERVARRASDLRAAQRRAFWEANRNLLRAKDWAQLEDQELFETFLDSPTALAGKEDVEATFELGMGQVAGAYKIGPFRLRVAGDEYWGAKLCDPATRYIDNLLTAIAHGRDTETKERLLNTAPVVRSFVSELLNLPLRNGNRFRDELGNLTDIAAARNAVLLWLRHNAAELLPVEALDDPTRIVAQECLRAGRSLLARYQTGLFSSGRERLKALVLLGLGASAVDFNNPEFQGRLAREAGPGPWILEFIQERTTEILCPELGGDRFLDEFYDIYLSSGRAATLAFLPGSAAQAYVSLAICQEMLRQNPSLQVLFIPKSGAPGNDLTFEDARAVLTAEAPGSLSDLIDYEREHRFILVPNGPASHGLNPARLSRDTAQALAKATVICAEGQAYAEIRGWRKPTYIAFRVNGRVAEAIHGVSRDRGACGFVRLTPGIDHFEGFEAAVLRYLTDSITSIPIRAASQTTSEYVEAVLGRNLSLIVDGLFHGDHREACRQLRAEATRLGKTFAEILIGAASKPPDTQSVKEYYEDRRYPVFACGGGGGFNGVTLKALRKLGLPTVAGVPSTDDGGSTGELQRWLRKERGFVFGVGDMASILQDCLDNLGKQAILAYRFDHEPTDLAAAVLERIVGEMTRPTYPDSPVGSAPDFLSFVCDQLNLARIIDGSFRNNETSPPLPVRGASIRNLNLIAAYELCNSLGDQGDVQCPARLGALYVLEKALGTRPGLMVLPVTYDECVLFLEYEDPVPPDLAKAHRLPPDALQMGARRLFGQQYIDKLPQEGRRRTAGVVTNPQTISRHPRANPEYLARLQNAELFIMGAGSLVSSQLAQLAIDGVVETLISRDDMRRILVINHVKMDETRGMTLRDHIQLIEAVATESVSSELLNRIAPSTRRLRISDLFTDIVIPRTVAREIEAEMLTRRFTWGRAMDDKPTFVELGVSRSGRSTRLLRNRYVDFLITHPDIQARLNITLREIEVLSYLEQPASLYKGRTEAGRYRGALFATDEDIRYLVEQGVQLRNIHEIDSIGENWKLLKSEGAPSFEFFPGLVPEALVGIIRIALERGSDKVKYSSSS
jgi:8-oxo-dGTP pyrophosphatase MutT (NUDIX family)/2-phospho-L-lactate transferase/gluconeogenesis factor (CofD/UPF0052 family)